MKYQAIISKLNGHVLGDTYPEYIGEGSTIEVAMKRARKLAFEDGNALISGEIDVYRLLNDEYKDWDGEWKQVKKYIGTFGV